jgi:hypothetical protein
MILIHKTLSPITPDFPAVDYYQMLSRTQLQETPLFVSIPNRSRLQQEMLRHVMHAVMPFVSTSSRRQMCCPSS